MYIVLLAITHGFVWLAILQILTRRHRTSHFGEQDPLESLTQFRAIVELFWSRDVRGQQVGRSIRKAGVWRQGDSGVDSASVSRWFRVAALMDFAFFIGMGIGIPYWLTEFKNPIVRSIDDAHVLFKDNRYVNINCSGLRVVLILLFLAFVASFLVGEHWKMHNPAPGYGYIPLYDASESFKDGDEEVCRHGSTLSVNQYEQCSIYGIAFCTIEQSGPLGM